MSEIPSVADKEVPDQFIFRCRSYDTRVQIPVLIFYLRLAIQLRDNRKDRGGADFNGFRVRQFQTLARAGLNDRGTAPPLCPRTDEQKVRTERLYSLHH